LGKADKSAGERESWTTALYRRVMTPLIHSARHRTYFFAGIAFLFLAAITLVPLGLVRVKMLPFDNKSELQVIINMPDGTPLEETTRVAQALGGVLAQQPDVLNYQIYAGTSGPYNFNGLVRHYYLRRQPNQADLQVNLLPAAQRHVQSHEIAKRLRPLLEAIGSRYGARLQVSEVPPGPPVLQTLVAEVYGPDPDGQIQVAQRIKSIFQQTPGVVDTDWYVEDPQPRLVMRVDEAKAAQHGIARSRWPCPERRPACCTTRPRGSRFPPWSKLTARTAPLSRLWRISACPARTARWSRCASWSS
jgi:multidrug efflux pump subunit AcrB